MNAEEAALRAIEALHHAILVMDADNRLVLANAALWKEAGVDSGRFPPGTPLRDIARLLAYRGLLGPGDPAALADQILAMDRSQFHLRHQRSADGARLSQISSQPLPGGGFVVCSVDITTLHRAETTARNRAALLERILNTQRGGIALFDAAKRLVLHNPAYRRHSNATAEMLDGRPTLTEIMQALSEAGEFPSSRDQDYVRKVISGERSHLRFGEREKMDGTVVRFHSTPQPDGGFLIESDDVTDLRRAEDEARRRAAILDGVLEALPHGVCVWSADRRVALFNDAYVRLMEGAPLQVGDTLEDVIRRRAAAGEYGTGEADAMYRLEMARDLSRPQERRRLRANGTALDVRTAPLPDGGHISVVTEITALWRAEDEARRRAELLETALGAIRHGIVICDPDHRVLAANQLARSLVGHEPGTDLVGHTAEEVIEQLHRAGNFGPEPAASELLRMALALDRTKPHVYQRTTPDGRVLEVASDPTPDGGFVITHSDITALAKAEDEASRRAKVLETAMASMRHGLIIYGPDRRVIAANELSAELGGHAPGSIRPGRLLDDLLGDLHAAGAYGPEPGASKRLKAGLAIDRSKPYRAVRETAGGRVLEISSDPTPDGGFIVTHFDITARARAEQAAQERARILQVMLDNTRHGICLFDANGYVVAANALAARICGLRPEQMAPGRHILEIRDEQAAAGEFGDPEAFARFVAGRPGDPWRGPHRYTRRRPNGMVLEITTDPTPDGGFVRTYNDVTEDRIVRDELERARAAAEAASEAKSRFLATMSHELRTPLASVIGYAEALLGETAPETIAEYAGAVRESGRQLLALIDDILEVARVGGTEAPGPVVPIDPAALVGSLAATAAPEAEVAGLRFETDAPPGLPRALCDERRLRRVLRALIANAVKFTPAGGSIRVAAAEDDDQGLVFRITDTGIGMAAKDIPRAFEPFTQLESSLARRYAGSGLGLHLAKLLTEAMGANLTLDSRPGEGTTATLRLPRGITISQSASAAPQETP
ncbi:PAS-domain containing protein [Roseomonas sp. HJA6]|uniref:histidine kinase n=1 Tax=Roseomonas alba TaxID=2846776 RepID=A0ABS7A255_9PROT|nr:PAS-domain containing protein [Neoroseomonas alba]